MYSKIILTLCVLTTVWAAYAVELVSIQKFDVLPENSPAVNKVNLQKAIAWASLNCAALYVEPSEEPYYIDDGLILKKNVFLIGTHRGTSHPSKKQLK